MNSYSVSTKKAVVLYCLYFIIKRFAPCHWLSERQHWPLSPPSPGTGHCCLWQPHDVMSLVNVSQHGSLWVTISQHRPYRPYIKLEELESVTMRDVETQCTKLGSLGSLCLPVARASDTPAQNTRLWLVNDALSSASHWSGQCSNWFILLTALIWLSVLRGYSI